MPLPSIVCLIVDRLQAGMLGCYGNTWVQTPSLDALAAGAFVFDQALVESPDLTDYYRAAWQGISAAASAGEATERSFVAEYRAAGGPTTLVTDEPQVAVLAGAAFADVDLVEAAEPERPAPTLDETQLARFFGAAIGRLEEFRSPGLLWLHARGLGGPWDAPLELRNQFADEQDPLPPELVRFAPRRLPSDYDPDELLGLGFAYAGQVAALDTCLGLALEALDASAGGREALVIFTAPRGYPLGEHLRAGPCDEPLYEENVHVPLVLRLPQGRGALERSQALVTPVDLYGTLRHWCGFSGGEGSLLSLVDGSRKALRDHVRMRSQCDRAIRTPAWHLRVSGTAEAPRRELFAKPSDRYEVNEVADRCEALAGELAAVLDRACPLDPTAAEPLDEQLVTVVD